MKILLFSCGLLLFMSQGSFALPHSSEFDPIFWDTQCQCDSDWYCGLIIQPNLDVYSANSCPLLSEKKSSWNDELQAQPLQFSNYTYRYYKPKEIFQKHDKGNPPPRPIEADYLGSNNSGIQIEENGEESTEADALSAGENGPVKESKPLRVEDQEQSEAIDDKDEKGRNPVIPSVSDSKDDKVANTIIHRLQTVQTEASSNGANKETNSPPARINPVARAKQKPAKERPRSSTRKEFRKSFAKVGELPEFEQYMKTSVDLEDEVSAILPKETVLNLEEGKDGASQESLMTFQYKVESTPVSLDHSGWGDALWVVIAFSIEKIFAAVNGFLAVVKYLMNPAFFILIGACTILLLGITQAHRRL